MTMSEDNFGFFEVEVTPGLAKVRNALIVALASEFGVEPNDRSYRPHVTLYQSATPEESAAARSIGPKLNLGTGFSPPTLDLVGRLGRPRIGARDILVCFPFSAP